MCSSIALMLLVGHYGVRTSCIRNLAGFWQVDYYAIMSSLSFIEQNNIKNKNIECTTHCNRDIVLEILVSVSRVLEINFLQSWSWSCYLWSWSWSRSWRIGLEYFQDRYFIWVNICIFVIFNRKNDINANRLLLILVWWVQFVQDFKGFHGDHHLQAATTVINISIG